jgi:hypothetical protein
MRRGADGPANLRGVRARLASPIWRSPIRPHEHDPKYVVSTTLTDPDWANTTVIASDVAERIGELKAQPDQDIVQYRFGSASTLLMEHGPA